MIWMTYISPKYRSASNATNPWMFLYLVMLVVSYAVVFTVGVACATMPNAGNMTLCNLWSWLIVALVAFGVLYTIMASYTQTKQE